MVEYNPFYDLPILETERIRLRRLSLDDAADVYEYAQDPEVSRYLTWEPSKSVDDSRAFLETVVEAYRQGKPADWGIEHKTDGRLIGTCGFIKWDQARNCAEIAYALARPYWNRGIVTEAAKAVTDFGFIRMGIYRLEAFCLPANSASARVMEKLGMRYEGTLRAYFLIKGDYRDMQVYSILKPEWGQDQ
jgi:ribosomal-protein-alanine N-acetyltransferase